MILTILIFTRLWREQDGELKFQALELIAPFGLARIYGMGGANTQRDFEPELYKRNLEKRWLSISDEVWSHPQILFIIYRDTNRAVGSAACKDILALAFTPMERGFQRY